MTSTFTRICAIAGSLAAAQPLFAHPGHGGDTGHGVAHYLLEPLHAFTIWAAPMAIVLAVIATARVAPRYCGSWFGRR